MPALIKPPSNPDSDLLVLWFFERPAKLQSLPSAEATKLYEEWKQKKLETNSREEIKDEAKKLLSRPRRRISGTSHRLR